MKLNDITSFVASGPIFRPLVPSDAMAFRSLRLRSLAEDPIVQGTTYEEESEIPLWRTESMLERTDDRVFLGCFLNDILIAIAGVVRDKPAPQRHRVHIWAVYVVPEHRGIGIGRCLMNSVLGYVTVMPGVIQANLYVDSENRTAISLYERVGFRRFGIEPNAVLIGEGFHDLLFMSVELGRHRHLNYKNYGNTPNSKAA